MRYLGAWDGQTSYGIEGTAYTKASDPTQYFGMVLDDVDFPNPNPQTPMAPGGTRRGVHVNSPDPRDFNWSIPVAVLDHNCPLEVALGTRTSTTKNSGGADEYTEHLITESDKLPTMTVRHNQDGVLEEDYVGTKANLTVTGDQGEPIQAEFDCVAQGHTSDDASPAAPDLGIPNQTPYRFWQTGNITLSNPSDGSPIKTIATIVSFSWGWDNGLEAQHHGDGRDPYSVAETTSAEKYDDTISINIVDTDLYNRAFNDDAPVDIEIPISRETAGGGTIIDGMFLRALNSTIDDAPLPNPSEGTIQDDVSFSPRDTEIEIREPA